ncbi:MAG: mechanosensitive ion channel [Eubacteriaceae bacterium]|nr:mechanosensitive ion channel [Eubacteriaceae bacterium]
MNSIQNALAKLIDSLTVNTVVVALFQLLVCVIITKLLKRATKNLLANKKYNNTVTKFLMSALSAVCWAVTLISIADYLGMAVSSIIAVFSMFGLAMSLSIQSAFSNLVAGLMLIALKPFDVGQFIEAASTSGTVSEVGLIYTKLNTIDRKLILIPNKDIMSGKITNYSFHPVRRIEVEVRAPSREDHKAVYECLKKAGQASTCIQPETVPEVGLAGINGISCTYTVRLWVPNSSVERARRQLYENIKTHMAAAGIQAL